MSPSSSASSSLAVATAAPSDLRLALGRDGLGFELAAAAPLAFAVVTAFRIALPRETAPLDVQGGLSSFSAARGARGELTELEVQVADSAFEGWLLRRAAQVLEGSSLRLAWGKGSAHLVFSVFSAAFAPFAVASGPRHEWGRAVFEVSVEGADVVVFLRDASGEHQGTTARALALAVLDEAFRGIAQAGDARFVVKAAIRRTVRAVLARAGVRAPRVDGRVWDGVHHHQGALVLSLASPRSTPLPPTTARSLRPLAAGSDAPHHPVSVLPASVSPVSPVSPPAAERALRQLVATLARWLDQEELSERRTLYSALAQAQLEGLGEAAAAARTREKAGASPPFGVPPGSSPADAGGEALGEAQAEARIEELTRRLQLDPGRDDVAEWLSALLLARGRGLELLALLNARLDEATPARRRELLPRQRAVLAQLEAAAHREGRTDDASLFAAALARHADET